MTAPKVMPFHPTAWLASTSSMSAAEKGVYIDLLCHQWEHEYLPSDPGELARLVRVEKRNFMRVWRRLARKFRAPQPEKPSNIHHDGYFTGNLQNFRLQEIRKECCRLPQNMEGPEVLTSQRVTVSDATNPPLTPPTIASCYTSPKKDLTSICSSYPRDPSTQEPLPFPPGTLETPQVEESGPHRPSVAAVGGMLRARCPRLCLPDNLDKRLIHHLICMIGEYPDMGAWELVADWLQAGGCDWVEMPTVSWLRVHLGECVAASRAWHYHGRPELGHKREKVHGMARIPSREEWDAQ